MPGLRFFYHFILRKRQTIKNCKDPSYRSPIAAARTFGSRISIVLACIREHNLENSIAPQPA